MDFIKDMIGQKMQEFVKDKFGMDPNNPGDMAGKTPSREQMLWIQEQAGDTMEEALMNSFSNKSSVGVPSSRPVRPGGAHEIARSLNLDQIRGFLQMAIQLMEKASQSGIINKSEYATWVSKVNVILKTADSYLGSKVSGPGRPHSPDYERGAAEAARLHAEAASKAGYRGLPPMNPPPSHVRNEGQQYQEGDYGGGNYGGGFGDKTSNVNSGLYPHVYDGQSHPQSGTFGSVETGFGKPSGGYGGNVDKDDDLERRFAQLQGQTNYEPGVVGGGGGYGSRNTEYGIQGTRNVGGGFGNTGGFDTKFVSSDLQGGVGGNRNNRVGGFDEPVGNDFSSTYERETGRKPYQVEAYQGWGGNLGPTSGGFGGGGENVVSGGNKSRPYGYEGETGYGGNGNEPVSGGAGTNATKGQTRGSTYGAWQG